MRTTMQSTDSMDKLLVKEQTTSFFGALSIGAPKGQTWQQDFVEEVIL